LREKCEKGFSQSASEDAKKTIFCGEKRAYRVHKKCSEGKASSIPYGIFSTQKIPSLRKEKAIKISQTTITNLKIELRAEWSKSPTVLTTTQAAKLVGCSNATINKWMKNEDGLRFVRSQNGIFTTKEWLIDYFAHYSKTHASVAWNFSN
jgi:phage antirepressor YoqD-like protein